MQAGAPLPVVAARLFGGHRFTRNGFGDNRDDLIARTTSWNSVTKSPPLYRRAPSSAIPRPASSVRAFFDAGGFLFARAPSSISITHRSPYLAMKLGRSGRR